MMETEEKTTEEKENKLNEFTESFVIKIDKDKLAEIIDFTNLADELVVKLREDGLHILQLDPSQIAEMRVDIPKEQLLEYMYNSTNPSLEMKIAFDRTKIKEILKVVDGDIIIRNLNSDLLLVADDSEFSVPFFEAKENVIKEPAYDTDYEITIPAKDLLNKIKEVELFSTHVAFETDGIGFSWSWEDRYKTKFKGFSLVALHPDNLQPAKAAYPLKYLKTILTGVKKYLVKIYFKTNSPIKIMVVKDGINVLYYLAPRVESV